MCYVSLHLGDAAISQLREEKEFAEGQVNECVGVKHHACVLLFVHDTSQVCLYCTFLFQMCKLVCFLISNL